MATRSEADPARELRRLHDRTDRLATRLARRHRQRLQCARGCSGCCVDGITVFAVEAERIRRGHPELLATGRPHPHGACAFLDAADGSCRIYGDRPYVCRTQGLPLRWLATGDGGSVHELRDICPLNEMPDRPIERLRRHDCWPLGTIEGGLAQLQQRTAGVPLDRVRLRDLFVDPIG